MAEKQGKLGDSWNDCAGRLLKKLGWQHIGDSNMDLPGSDDKEYGVDSIFKYSVAGRSAMQTVILESKRYQQTSLRQTTLQNWVKRLKDKLNALRNSESLKAEFKELEDCLPVNLGIIMCWVHDGDKRYLNETFQQYLENTIITSGAKSGAYSRIMILDNRRIVKLCSMVDELNKFDDYDFVYPSGIIDNDVLVAHKVLSVEYMMSDIIIAECKKEGERSSAVFYFGQMTETAVSSLLECLKVYQRLEEKKPLAIYYYDNNDNSIDVINSFKKRDCYKDILEFRPLTHYSLDCEPSIIANND